MKFLLKPGQVPKLLQQKKEVNPKSQKKKLLVKSKNRIKIDLEKIKTMKSRILFALLNIIYENPE